MPALTVRCGSAEAALAALENGADRVLIGGEVATGLGQRWSLETLRETAERAHAQGSQALLATPRMSTELQIEEYHRLLERLAPGEFDAIHVHNIGMLRLVRGITRETPVPLSIHADFSFNLFNASGVDALAGLGARQATLSLEVTLPQAVAIRAGTAVPLELIVHGSLPGMVLEQCAVAALTLNATPDDPCPAPCQSRQYALRDQVGQIHPIMTDQYCRNHLLMGKDLCTLGHLEPFLRARPASLRLELPYADAAQVALATALYRRAMERFAAGRRGRLVEEDELHQLRESSPRPLSLGAFANAYHPLSLPDGELPTNLLIKYGSEGCEQCA